jgi:hypothetical protein
MTPTVFITRNLLITGGEHINRIDYAKDLAMKQLCLNLSEGNACKICVNCLRVLSNTHPNLIVIEPELSGNAYNFAVGQNISDVTGLIKIDQIRRIIMEHQKANFEKGISAVIITHIHKITMAAANALLKVLEENKEDKIFLALAPTRMAVLPTIASRLMCHLIKPSALLGCSEEKRTKVITVSTTKPLKRFALCAQFNTDRDELLNEIGELTNTCHALLRQKLIYPRFALALAEALINAESGLKKNLNSRLVIETLILREWPYMEM